jgi:hypothetical protein
MDRKDFEGKSYTMDLPVRLADDELLRVAKVLAKELKAKDKLETEAKVSAQEFKDKLKEADSTVSDLAHVLKTGQEVRPVDVVEQPDFSRGIVLIVRLDTEEPVSQRRLEEHERQVSLQP